MSQVSDYNSYSSTLQRQQDSYDRERSENRTNHEKEIQNLKKEQAEALQARTKDYNERLQEERSEAKDEVKRLKEELYDSKGKKLTQDLQGGLDEKKLLHEYREQANQEATKKAKNAETAASERVRIAQENGHHQTEDALAAQRESQKHEMQDLHDSLAAALHDDRDVAKERAQAKQQSIQEYERDHINEKQRIVDGFSTSLKHAKEKNDEQHEFFSRQLTEGGIEANVRAQKQLSLQKKEFQAIDIQKGDELQHLKDQQTRQMSAERQNHEKMSRNMIVNHQDQMQKELGTKDKIYRDYIKDTSDRHHQELKMSEDEVARLKNTGDPAEVSPYVVGKIQGEAEKRYHQSMEEHDRQNDFNLQAARKRDGDERRDLQGDYQQKYTAWTREHRRDQDLQNKTFARGYQDLQEQKDSMVSQLRDKNANSMERNALTHAEDLKLQQRRHMDAMDETHDQFHHDKNQLLDDVEANQRMQTREWTLKTNDMRRDYEKKLAEARDLHDQTMSELRLEYDKKIRDQERLLNRGNDERIKAYEHQLRQQELSFREKERFLTEHYEEELGRMKSTNAKLVQKKS